jgi:hypothetical protein
VIGPSVFSVRPIRLLGCLQHWSSNYSNVAASYKYFATKSETRESRILKMYCIQIRDISVGVATGYELDGPVSIFFM